MGGGPTTVAEGMVLRLVLGLFWAWLVGWRFLSHGLVGSWSWALSLGLSFYFHVLCNFYFLVGSGLLSFNKSLSYSGRTNRARSRSTHSLCLVCPREEAGLSQMDATP